MSDPIFVYRCDPAVVNGAQPLSAKVAAELPVQLTLWFMLERAMLQALPKAQLYPGTHFSGVGLPMQPGLIDDWSSFCQLGSEGSSLWLPPGTSLDLFDQPNGQGRMQTLQAGGYPDLKLSNPALRVPNPIRIEIKSVVLTDQRAPGQRHDASSTLLPDPLPLLVSHDPAVTLLGLNRVPSAQAQAPAQYSFHGRTLQPDRWYQLTATFAADGVRYFVDGSAVGAVEPIANGFMHAVPGRASLLALAASLCPFPGRAAMVATRKIADATKPEPLLIAGRGCASVRPTTPGYFAWSLSSEGGEQISANAPAHLVALSEPTLPPQAGALYTRTLAAIQSATQTQLHDQQQQSTALLTRIHANLALLTDLQHSELHAYMAAQQTHGIWWIADGRLGGFFRDTDAPILSDEFSKAATAQTNLSAIAFDEAAQRAWMCTTANNTGTLLVPPSDSNAAATPGSTIACALPSSIAHDPVTKCIYLLSQTDDSLWSVGTAASAPRVATKRWSPPGATAPQRARCMCIVTLPSAPAIEPTTVGRSICYVPRYMHDDLASRYLRIETIDLITATSLSSTSRPIHGAFEITAMAAGCTSTARNTSDVSLYVTVKGRAGVWVVGTDGTLTGLHDGRSQVPQGPGVRGLSVDVDAKRLYWIGRPLTVNAAIVDKAGLLIDFNPAPVSEPDTSLRPHQSLATYPQPTLGMARQDVMPTPILPPSVSYLPPTAAQRGSLRFALDAVNPLKPAQISLGNFSLAPGLALSIELIFTIDLRPPPGKGTLLLSLGGRLEIHIQASDASNCLLVVKDIANKSDIGIPLTLFPDKSSHVEILLNPRTGTAISTHHAWVNGQSVTLTQTAQLGDLSGLYALNTLGSGQYSGSVSMLRIASCAPGAAPAEPSATDRRAFYDVKALPWPASHPDTLLSGSIDGTEEPVPLCTVGNVTSLIVPSDAGTVEATLIAAHQDLNAKLKEAAHSVASARLKAEKDKADKHAEVDAEHKAALTVHNQAVAQATADRAAAQAEYNATQAQANQQRQEAKTAKAAKIAQAQADHDRRINAQRAANQAQIAAKNQELASKQAELANKR